ncbi:MAG: 50S ribosomal protein L30 [Eubacteriales bacterium]|nr:50S ribosomal protein L30 [Eubacteriales bacterium]
MADKKLKVTLVRSTIGCVPKHKKIVEGIGLRKLNHTVELPDNEGTRGIIRQVGYLLKVEE